MICSFFMSAQHHIKIRYFPAYTRPLDILPSAHKPKQPSMKKLLIMLLFAGMVFACNEMQDGASGPVYDGPGTTFCDSGSGKALCSYLPYEVAIKMFAGYDSFLDSVKQPPFDQFSWQTFVALNWPANAMGTAIGNSIGDYPDSMRVWEYYTDPASVFRTCGITPNSNNSPDLLLQLNNAMQSDTKLFYMDSKSPERLHVRGFREADGHPLIDRNLNFALYEIKMNPSEVRFVTTNNLRTADSIVSYTKRVGEFSLPSSDSAKGDPGTIEIKASWRILDPAKGDDTSRYYCRNAVIYIDAAHVVNNKPLTIRAKVGLVGMHIVRKTATFGMMIWSSFEHIDNTPDNPQEAQDAGRRWSFYNPHCLNCPINDTPVFQQNDNQRYRWDSTAPWGKRYAVNSPSQQTKDSFGTQVIRMFPIYKYTNRINDAWRAKLKGTVWANYRLIGSQWQSAEIIPAPNAPALLGNTTLETYIQPFASCISCHGDATVSYKGDTVKTDLSFIFSVFAR